MDKQAGTFTGWHDAGKDVRPRIRWRTGHGQSPALRLLRRRPPRNDMRAAGIRNPGPSAAGRGSKYAEQSQFVAGRNEH
jgi:hypothetical protein